MQQQVKQKISGPHNLHRWQSCILTISPWIWAFNTEPDHLTRTYQCLKLPNMISQRSGLATATSSATPLTCCWPGWTEATATRRTRTGSSPWSRCIRKELISDQGTGAESFSNHFEIVFKAASSHVKRLVGERGEWEVEVERLRFFLLLHFLPFFLFRFKIEVLLSSTREQHKARSRELRDQCKSLCSLRLITYNSPYWSAL